MSAKCPSCKWELPIFGKRPLKDATFRCPECEAELIFRTRSLIVKSVFIPILFFLLARMRANDADGGGLAMLGFALALIMFVVWVHLERFELVASPSEEVERA